MSYAFISLFSGAGGLDLGFEQAGWKCRYASDFDEAAVATLQANRGISTGRGRKALTNAFIEQSDIRTLRASEVLKKAGVAKGEVPLLLGGPPCQSWSSAGHQLGFSDPRGRLFEDFIRLAGGLGVRWLLFENVRGLLTARGSDGRPGSALHLIRNKLLEAGFQTTVALLNAADYGVPQRRVRLFVMAFKCGDPPPFPTPTHQKDAYLFGRSPWLTLGNAIAGIRPLRTEEVVRPNPRLAEELARIPDGCGIKSPGKEERTRPGGHWGYKQGAFIADLQTSARTVTANQQQDWVRDPGLGLRKLCPRECAAIQSFPPEWIFADGQATQYRLIGNAVPPLLARAIGITLLRHVRRHVYSRTSRFSELLPLPPKLDAAIQYTAREETSNGESRRNGPVRRVSRLSHVGPAVLD